MKVPKPRRCAYCQHFPVVSYQQCGDYWHVSVGHEDDTTCEADARTSHEDPEESIKACVRDWNRDQEHIEAQEERHDR